MKFDRLTNLWNLVHPHKQRMALVSGAAGTAGLLALSLFLALGPGGGALKTLAATQTWDSQGDWAGWTMNSTSASTMPGSLVLNSSKVNYYNIISSGSLLKSSQVYDPVANKIYTMGGTDMFGTAVNTIYEFDVASKTATLKGSTLPAARELGSAVWDPLNSKAYFFGGTNTTGSAVYNTIYEYEPSTGAVTTKSEVLPAAVQLSTAIWNSTTNTAFIYGGINIGVYSGAITEYDPATGIVTTRSETLPTGLYGMASVWNPATNEAYLFGGNKTGNINSAAIIEHDIGSGSVTTRSETLPTAAFANSAAWNPTTSKAYVFNVSSAANDIIEFDPNAATVTLSADKLTNLMNANYMSAIWSSSDNRIYIAGIDKYMLQYDPSTPTYSSTGYAYKNFDSTNTSNTTIWNSITKTETLNGQTIAYYAMRSTTTSCTSPGGSWTGWTPIIFSGSTSTNLGSIVSSRYFCIGTQLTTSNSTQTPQVDALTLTYTPDTATPTILMTSPNGGTTVSTTNCGLTISGTAADDVGVASVTSNNGTVTGTTSWTLSGMNLNIGSNTVTLTVTDLTGKTATLAITITTSGTVSSAGTKTWTSQCDFAGWAKNSTSSSLTADSLTLAKSKLITRSETLTAPANRPTTVWDQSTGKAYIFGGQNSSAIREYTPSTGVMTTRTETLPWNLESSLAIWNSTTHKAYLFGGYSSTCPNGNTFIIACKQILEFDPSAGSVTTKNASLPYAQYGGNAVWDPSSGKAYIIGGYTQTNYMPGDAGWILEYDPATDTLITKNSAFGSQQGNGFITSGGTSSFWNTTTSTIFIVGGGAGQTQSNGIYEYNPSTDALALRTETLPAPRSNISAAWDPGSGTVYLLGGNSGNTKTSQILSYVPATGTLRVQSDVLPTATTTATSFYNSGNNRIYTLGGNDGVTGNLSSIIEYSPLTPFYIRSGFGSQVFDSSYTKSQWNLTKGETLNGQTVTYYGQTSSSVTCPAGGTSWIALTFSGNTATNLSALGGGRYICVRAQLSTTNDMVSPQVDDLTLSFSPDAAPTITTSTPFTALTFYTNASPLTITGTATDDVGIANVSSTRGTVTGTTSYTVNGITLTAGNNFITLTATDTAGQTVNRALTIVYDTVAPNLTTTSPVSLASPATAATYYTNQSTVTVSGTASDSYSLGTITSNKGPVTGTSSWSIAGISLSEGSNPISITATDTAGNSFTQTITVIKDTVLPQISLATPTTNGGSTTSRSTTIAHSGTASDNNGILSVTATSGSITGTTSWNGTTATLPQGNSTVTFTARDLAGNTATTSYTVFVDSIAPGPVAIDLATCTATGSTIAWQASSASDVVGYVLLRSGSPSVPVPVGGSTYATGDTIGSSDVVANSTATTYSGSGLTTNTDYYWFVYAYDSLRNYSSVSSVLTHTGNTTPATLTFTVPTVSTTNPSGIVSRSGDTVTATFTASSSLAGNPTVTLGGIVMTFSSSSGTGYSYTRVLSGTETEGTALLSVTGTGTNGATGNTSTTVATDFTPPITVTDLRATPGDGQIGLDWTLPGDISILSLHRSASSLYVPNSANRLVTTVGASYMDTTAVNGTPYFYVVLTQDLAGNTAYAAPVRAVADHPTLSLLPFSTATIPLGSMIPAQWGIHDLNSLIQSIAVHSSTDDGTTYPTSLTVLGGTATAYQWTPAQVGSGHRLRIQGRNASGTVIAESFAPQSVTVTAAPVPSPNATPSSTPSPIATVAAFTPVPIPSATPIPSASPSASTTPRVSPTPSIFATVPPATITPAPTAEGTPTPTATPTSIAAASSTPSPAEPTDVAPVKNLRAEVNNNSSVTLTYDKLPEKIRVKVYRIIEGTSQRVLIGDTDQAFYVDKAVAPGQRYFYSLVAYRPADGKISVPADVDARLSLFKRLVNGIGMEGILAIVGILASGLTGLITSGAGAAASGLAAGLNPRELFTYLFFWLPRRKRRSWATVRSSATGLPIAGARVGLVPSELSGHALQTITDPAGNFSFSLTKEGIYTLALSALSFLSLTWKARTYTEQDHPQQEVITLDSDQNPSAHHAQSLRLVRVALKIELVAALLSAALFGASCILAVLSVIHHPDSISFIVLALHFLVALFYARSYFNPTISGTVLTSEGFPVGDVTVRAFKVTPTGPVLCRTRVSSVKGVFSLKLSPGTYRIAADRRSYEQTASDPVVLTLGRQVDYSPIIEPVQFKAL